MLISMKKFLFVMSTIYYLVSTNSPVSAASEFTTSFNSLYTVLSSGDTQVIHTITLKNNLSYIYATNYSIATSGDDLSEITTSDEYGSISHSITSQNGVTTIHLTIARPAVGLDQLKTLTISYKTKDIVEQIGATTTINIPRLARANEAENYVRVVKVEAVANQATHIFPQPSGVEQSGDFTTYTFVAHQSDALTLLFGDSVTYKLNLTYELKNKELSSIDSELALPPDTSYQHIVIGKLDPPPLDIHLDPDGNWLARYNLAPQEKRLVHAELYATIYPVPTLPDPSTTSLPNTTKSLYWDFSATPVTDLAGQLKTPENIYHYLASNFSYAYANSSAGSPRLGALAALASPSNVLCTEFTDSFVALTRALSIPSRELNGYVYTKSSLTRPIGSATDILHAWPEYYDLEKFTWTQLDPTWGNTTGGVDYFHKLDFSHITFVRHGVEDSYPLPAGAYKSNPNEKYIEVVVSEPIEENQDIVVQNDIVYNHGNVAIVHEDVGYLPPYGSAPLPLQKSLSFYDKIKIVCAKLLSIFYRPH